MLPNAVPKPVKSKKVRRVSLPRTARMKSVNRKRGGSSFPKQRDRVYRHWIWTENPCMLAGKPTLEPMSTHDKPHKSWWVQGAWMDTYLHVCWGAMTPAHVGEHQAQGAPDFGVLVPLCKAAHQFYDEHREQWAKATGFTEAKMALRASGYALKYVERRGIPEHP